MMVSSTPCCARPESARRWLVALLLGVWLALAGGGALAAEKSAVRQAVIRATPQGYVIDGDVNIVLNSTLEDALTRGINLYFVLELEVTRPRSWWFDESIGEATRKLRIYYHLLLRRYVVENGYTTRTAATLAEALAMLGRIDDWQVLERGALKTGHAYDARLRLRLDTSQLPKPLVIGAVGGDRWELATPWYGWSFDAPALAAAPASSP
ncbi:DUF4390 domain-containing protein [Thiobacillus sedimenti]|uniref:DUF4390 domain-containing protein n=1 Tax=Thiobacillus sedimenti TaxID=3110231 RepID=A0ABZ1CIT1_9PROT|nr:DUF4390 domain-containing protein [Thiobacillus sp. SCUT-2]WRS39298.1 DUF4390 domain-containing protein [Thiobacillus sp. SCUT-2]